MYIIGFMNKPINFFCHSSHLTPFSANCPAGAATTWVGLVSPGQTSGSPLPQAPFPYDKPAGNLRFFQKGLLRFLGIFIGLAAARAPGPRCFLRAPSALDLGLLRAAPGFQVVPQPGWLQVGFLGLAH